MVFSFNDYHKSLQIVSGGTKSAYNWTTTVNVLQLIDESFYNGESFLPQMFSRIQY